MRRIILATSVALSAMVWCGLAGVSTAYAQSTQTQRDLAASARQAVNQVVYASTSTAAAAERALDARINEQHRAIEALRQRLTQAGGRNEALAAELSTAQERYVAHLSERERAYAQEIAVLRGAAEDIASTPDGLAALERFNAGDELGALLALDRLSEARERARQVRNNIESAAEARDIAVLAYEANQRGRLEVSSVIARLVEITRMDPSVYSDWIMLAHLNQDAGRLNEARQTAERAEELGRGGPDHYAAAGAFGELALATGDLRTAQRIYETTCDELRSRVATDSRDLLQNRDLATCLQNLALIMRRSGDPRRALALLDEARGVLDRSIAGATAAHDARAGGFQLDMARLYAEFGDLNLAIGEFDSARRALAESNRIAEGLLAANPDASEAKATAGLAQVTLGNLAAEQGDLASAIDHYERCLILYRSLTARDASNAAQANRLASALLSAAQAYRRRGDVARARIYVEESLALLNRFATSAAISTALQKNQAIALQRLGDLSVAERDFQAGLEYYEESLTIFSSLAQSNVGNRDLQIDTAMAHAKAGRAAHALDARVLVESHFGQAIAILERVTSVTAADRAQLMMRFHAYILLENATNDQGYLRRALDLALEMRANGIWAPEDESIIEELQRNLAREPAAIGVRRP